MSVSVQYTSNRTQIDATFQKCLRAFLEEAGGEIESAAIANTPSGDTGRLRGDWRHIVNTEAQNVVIGNSTEHAIWVERGTGEYAINGDGRKGAWVYRDENGVYHKTTGNRPVRMLENAWNERIRGVMDVLLPAKFKELSE